MWARQENSNESLRRMLRPGITKNEHVPQVFVETPETKHYLEMFRDTTPMITEKDKALAIKARDARDTYDSMYQLFLEGKVSQDEIVRLHKEAEDADKALRKAVKSGVYRNIEKDLKNKYKK